MRYASLPDPFPNMLISSDLLISAPIGCIYIVTLVCLTTYVYGNLLY